MAREAGEIGGTAPAVLCAADEVAVDMFLQSRIPFVDIATVIEDVLYRHQPQKVESADQLFEVERWAKHQAELSAGRLIRPNKHVTVAAARR